MLVPASGVDQARLAAAARANGRSVQRSAALRPEQLDTPHQIAAAVAHSAWWDLTTD